MLLHSPADTLETTMRAKLLLSLVTLVCVASIPALAESRPHKMFGTGQFTSATDFASDGFATHLGRFKELGSVQFSATGDPTVLQINGWAIHTAANGDQVYELISGQLNLATGAGTA